jgi:hypothetical protein
MRPSQAASIDAIVTMPGGKIGTLHERNELTACILIKKTI